MELLDNDHVDEQSGEGLVIQHFDKLVFWQRFTGLLLIFSSGFFWWVILTDPYINGERYTIIFSVATAFSLLGIATFVFSLQQVKQTKKTTPNTISVLFKQQSYLWTIFIGGILFFVVLIGYNLFGMVMYQWREASDFIEKPMPPPPPQEMEVMPEEVVSPDFEND